jgi:lysophospholipase L1-like esterase
VRAKIGVVAALLLAAPGIARAGDRVIPPEAGDLVFPALQRTPGFTIASVRIERVEITANLCRVVDGGISADPLRCFTLRLSDPRLGCAAPAGAFCLSFPDGAPPDGVRAPLTAALAALPEASIWRDSDVTVPSATPPPSPPPPPPRHPAALALAVTLAPLAVGLALALAVRPLLARVRRRAALAVALLLAAVGAGIAAVPVLPRVGAWDVVTVALLFGIGFAAAGSRLPLRALLARLALAIGGMLAAIGVLELAARALPAPAASFAKAAEARFVFAESPRYETCAPLDPAGNPSVFAARTAHALPKGRVVMHLGDSMVEGVGVQPEQAFPALLDRAEPGVFHVNAGFASTSIDFQLLVARAWLDRLPVSRLVVYVFGYNDLAELDGDHPCCPGGPLLDADARARCPTPRLPSARRDLLATSPAPYAVRVAADRSALARRIAVGFAGASAKLAHRRRREDPEERFRRYAATMEALRDEAARRHVRLTVVYLPARAALESAAPEASADHALKERVMALCRDLHVGTLDPWDMLADAVRRDGAGRVYLPPPDVHFTPEGHRLMAEWLAPRLRE